MTEELKAEIDEYVRDTCVYYRSTHEDMLPNHFEKYLRKACIHFATKNGIQWHDLRKNPNDLPDTDRFVHVQTMSDTGKAYYDDGWYSGGINGIVIAWCEEPQFKG